MFAKLALLSVFLVTCWSSVSGGKVVCYWGTWSVYKQDPMKYGANDIPADKCTHIIYAFAKLDEGTSSIKEFDPYADIDKKGYENFVGLKQKNSNLKALIAIGGWNEGGTKYSNMAADPNKRKTFVKSVVDFLDKYKFDGLDVDWEYPAAGDRGGKPQDKQNLAALLKELSAALKPKGKLLTIAVACCGSKVEQGYDVRQVAEAVDHIHVMTYDMRGPWDKVTDVHTPLKKRAIDSGDLATWNIQDSLKLWETKGAPKSKLFVGLAFYGHTWALQNPGQHGLHAPASGPGEAGQYSQQGGTLYYYELCQKVKDGWTKEYDKEGEAPYAYKGNQWVGYDDEKSLTVKVNFIKQGGYGGAMIWSLDEDDFKGVCGGAKHTLLEVVNKGMKAMKGG